MKEYRSPIMSPEGDRTIIYALVDAPTQEIAIEHAETSFDIILESVSRPIECFTTYRLFQGDNREELYDRWGQYPLAARITSEVGEELLDIAWLETETNFEENLEIVRDLLESTSAEEIMENRYLARNAFLRVGAFRGQSVPLYGERGAPIRDRQTLEKYLEQHTQLWIVPAEAMW